MEPLKDSCSHPAGIAEIRYTRRGGATRLAHLYQCDPLRVLFPAPEPGDIEIAVLLTTSGGLVAGDRLRISVGVGKSAALHVSAAAAEKVYRSTGATTAIVQQLSVEEGGWLEYLPPEAILFDGVRLRRTTSIELAAGAGFLGGGILVFGRRARGEWLRQGLLNERWEVWREGGLVWGDALHLDGDIAATIANPACFAGAAACATLILAPPAGKLAACLAAVRALQSRMTAPGLQAGATALGGLLIARWLAEEAMPLRRAYADLACHLRAAALGLPPRLPRIWHI